MYQVQILVLSYKYVIIISSGLYIGGVQNHNLFQAPLILDEVFVLIHNLKIIFPVRQYSAGNLGAKYRKSSFSTFKMDKFLKCGLPGRFSFSSKMGMIFRFIIKI